MPKVLPNFCRQRLSSPQLKCWVQLFKLDDGSRFTETIVAKWKMMPMMFASRSYPEDRYGLRVQVKDGQLSELMSASELFSESNLSVFSSRSMIVFVQLRSEGKCLFSFDGIWF